MKIIKTIFLATCVFVITQTVNAQKNIGIRAGWNSATISGSNLGNINSRDAFYIGVFKELGLVPQLVYLDPELQYSSQGFKANGKDYMINYLNIPIMGKVYFLKLFSFEAGPQFGFKLSDNIDNSNIKTFDMGIAGGIGFNLPFGLSINGRYIQGLSELNGDNNAKNQVWQVGAAFRF